jgi:hypothetical protein
MLNFFLQYEEEKEKKCAQYRTSMNKIYKYLLFSHIHLLQQLSLYFTSSSLIDHHLFTFFPLFICTSFDSIHSWALIHSQLSHSQSYHLPPHCAMWDRNLLYLTPKRNTSKYLLLLCNTEVDFPLIGIFIYTWKGPLICIISTICNGEKALNRHSFEQKFNRCSI